ncbi:hypothetical protein [Algoriphagus namhaensis]
MNALQFLELAKSDKPLKKADFLKVAKLQEAFPYFLIPHVLAAKFEKGKGNPETSESLGLAAINTSDRVWLKKLLSESTASQSGEASSQDLLPETKSSHTAEQRTKSLKELGESIKGVQPETKKSKTTRKRKAKSDELIETIKKKEKKPIQDSNLLEQRDLIKSFSKKSIKLATIKEIESNQNKENLAEASTHVNDNLVSEPLAALMIKQGKPEKAKEIYEKLILKFPEKKTYFADLIEKLKE